MSKYLVYSLLWSMSGDGKLKIRKEMGNFVRGVTTIPLPPTTNNAIIDFEVIVKYMYRMSFSVFAFGHPFCEKSDLNFLR